MKGTFFHYYNNEEYCPYDEFGCKFRHEKHPNCSCKKKLCQFRQLSLTKDKISKVMNDSYILN